jgi:D-galactose 1-dehydrogenase
VLLEKPPSATLGEVQDLIAGAKAAGRTLFAAWHSQHAAAIDAARHWIADHPLRRVQVDWQEDVRIWHPGQRWIWQADGLGVFDPGINALSILTALIAAPIHIQRAVLRIPQNRTAPIAAELSMAAGPDIAIEAVFDWRRCGEPLWDIVFAAQDGAEMRLSMGGNRISTEADGAGTLEGEYDRIYRRFAALIANRDSDVHIDPLRLVADAALVGERITVEPYEEAE